MKYLSVCSGIEAATVAWHPLGWEPAAFAEIEKFPAAVLDYHYPHVRNLGDMTKYKEWDIGNIDVLAGGTPCQSFSVAGLRKGLDDPRGNLALVYLGIAERFRPRWILWENVPGVLSSYSGPEPPSDLEEGQEWEAEETSDFECFTTALVQLGYGFAYRILDAQFFGVPQRRRRVFVVGYLGDWRPPAAVLFERHSLSGNLAPSRETGQDVAALTATGVGTCGADDNQGQAGHLISVEDTAATLKGGSGHRGWNADDGAPLVCMSTGQSSAEIGIGIGTTLNCNHEAPIIVHGTQDPCVSDIAFAQGRNNGGENVVCFTQNDAARDHQENVAPTLRSGSNGGVVNQCVAFAQNTRDEVRLLGGDGKIAGALAAETGMKQQTYLCVGFNGDQSEKTHSTGEHEEQSPTLRRDGPCHVAVQAFEPGVMSRDGGHIYDDISGTIRSEPGDNRMSVLSNTQVRRLTPIECERLQGFQDNYTRIPWRNKPEENCPDGPRYKALGNSMAVPVMRWLGERISVVDKT